MREAGWGRIVLLSAGSAYLRNHAIYGLAKQALGFLAEELALELGPAITVNAVAPGQIAESADDIAEHDPSFVERAIAHTPAGRLVTRAEVAELVARCAARRSTWSPGRRCPSTVAGDSSASETRLRCGSASTSAAPTPTPC